MPKGRIGHLRYGQEAWLHLETIINRGHSRGVVFLDWLDLMLTSYLSLTDNLRRPKFTEKLKANKLDGEYEDRYMRIVERYKDSKPRGERAIDLFAQAYGALTKEIGETQFDALGEIYEHMISYGEHGQFFTPTHVTHMMAEIAGIKDGETVADPCCGSGRMLLSAAKVNPNAVFYGIDVDERCAKMCALNMVFFNLNGEVLWGDSLAMKFRTQWNIGRGGIIVETDAPVVNELPRGQQELFKAA